MAGLLDFDTEQMRLGMGLLAAGGARSDGANTGQRLMEALGSVDQWKQGKQKQKLYDMQMREAESAMADKEAQRAEQLRIKSILAGAPMLQTPADFQALRQQGVPFEAIKQMADIRNLGRDKVARTAEIEGPNGSKMIQGFDDYGQPVGQGSQGYVAPQLIDQGDRKIFAKPVNGQTYGMGLSPSNQIQIRGQNMTDSRARDLNAISQQANGIKLNEKQEAANLAKGGQIASFDVMLGSLDRLSKHPGLGRSVGIVGAFPTMPGSESANFKAELDTFQSQAFLPMVSQLKGMGALSDAEGKKLTAAVGALNPAMGEKAFRESIARITSDMTAARRRLAGGANGASGGWDAPAQSGGWSIQKAD